MKQLFKALLCAALLGSSLYGANQKTAWICAQEDMDDEVFITKYPTREACWNNCRGFATVCQEVSAKTSINETEVD